VPPSAGEANALERPAPENQSAEKLYLQLHSVGLDSSRVYHARAVSFDRSAIHITLDDGTIAFTKDVAGRVTGAFFEGDGEVLVMPPDQVERASMMLFTGAAILEERFVTAYFRFNDDTYAELQPRLRPADNPEEFVNQWNRTAQNLATVNALRLLLSFSRLLPVASAHPPEVADEVTAKDDRLLYASVQGRSLGTFDLSFDSTAAEQIRVGQFRTVDGEPYYDVWTSFSPKSSDKSSEAASRDADDSTGEADKTDALHVSGYKIRAQVHPPTELEGDATLNVQVKQGGARAVLFELSRFLQLERVEADGRPLEFVHNPALEGTQLARRGNDVVAVVFPQTLRSGQRIDLRFAYRGAVLSEVGGGLLYVGARGTWYPNRGPAMSNYDLEFSYPAGWTLVATGLRREVVPSTSGSSSENAPSQVAPGEQVARWVSERPIPMAGFNLGKYTRAVAHAGGVEVDVYATSGVERGFPKAAPVTVIPSVPGMTRDRQPPLVIAPPPPSPAQNEQSVADEAARAVEFFAHRFGPYPYRSLAVTQIPGGMSQGWPGLVFLSSISFLTPEEQMDLHLRPLERTRSNQVVAHETAHQWWGDVVTFSSYRDQWIVEGLAEYSSLMLLESRDAAKFHAILQQYRDQLLEKNKDGKRLMDAGPVTLGIRLSCSPFPKGYEAISYGRGAWLFHMLRTMMRDAELRTGRHFDAGEAGDEPFLRALRKLGEHYQGKPVSTRELLRVFEEELPPSLRYEGRKSLDWFYEGWVNGTAIPHLQLRGVKYTDHAGSTTISGVITQTEAPSDLVTPVPLYGTVGRKNVLLGQVFADGEETDFHLTAPPGTRMVVVDPEQTLLARTR